MKSFKEWHEEKKMSEGLLPFLGAMHHGPLGYQIGKSLEKSFNSGSSAHSSSSEMPYRYDKKEDDKKPWYQKDLMQYVPGSPAHLEKKRSIERDAEDAKIKKDIQELISKGWEPDDASTFIMHYKQNESSPVFGYYKRKYPNYFNSAAH